MKEIDKELEEKLNEMKDEIKKRLDNINNKVVNIFEEGEKQIMEFSEGTIVLELSEQFNNYLLAKIGDQNINSNLLEQLFLEIKSVQNLSKIYKIKGFGGFIKSTFSDYHYISNTIDILFESFVKKFDYISLLLSDNLLNYIQGLSHKVNIAYDRASIKFTNEQSEIWKEIADYYQSNKNKIENAKYDILNKYE